jgi:hypothetical protein
MKSFLQFVGFVLIIVGGFWVGMQWGSVRPTSGPVTNPILPERPANTVIPVIVPAEEVIPETTVSTDVEVLPSNVPVNTAIDPNLPKNKTDKVIHYESSRFKYGFDMPANVYFSAFPGEASAVHTVGIGKEDPETLVDAAVRIYFYGKKILPELQNSTKYVDPAGTYVYLLVNGYSVKIEALNIDHPVVQKIIETLQVNV